MQAPILLSFMATSAGLIIYLWNSYLNHDDVIKKTKERTTSTPEMSRTSNVGTPDVMMTSYPNLYAIPLQELYGQIPNIRTEDSDVIMRNLPNRAKLHELYLTQNAKFEAILKLVRNLSVPQLFRVLVRYQICLNDDVTKNLTAEEIALECCYQLGIYNGDDVNNTNSLLLDYLREIHRGGDDVSDSNTMQKYQADYKRMYDMTSSESGSNLTFENEGAGVMTSSNSDSIFTDHSALVVRHSDPMTSYLMTSSKALTQIQEQPQTSRSTIYLSYANIHSDYPLFTEEFGMNDVMFQLGTMSPKNKNSGGDVIPVLKVVISVCVVFLKLFFYD